MRQITLNRLDLNPLKVFVVILEESNVTATGARLGLAQSSTSHALSRLREAFDDQPFVRGAEGMTLTPYAMSLVDPIMRHWRTCSPRRIMVARSARRRPSAPSP